MNHSTVELLLEDIENAMNRAIKVLEGRGSPPRLVDIDARKNAGLILRDTLHKVAQWKKDQHGT